MNGRYPKIRKAVAAGVQAPSVEPDAIGIALAKIEAQTGGASRIRVRFVRFSIRECDEDGLCNKYLLDQMRYSGLIQDDKASLVQVIQEQIKVKTRLEEGTLIELIYP